MKPLIGITVGEIHNALYPWGPVVYGQNYDYCEAVERAGGIPCLIPLMTDQNNLKQLYEKLDGLLLSGGNDINPKLYGEKPYLATLDSSDRRDDAEIQLLRWAMGDKKPVLGICRGMQLINVACGGTLYQNIPDDVEKASDHTISTVRRNSEHKAHNIKIEPKSRLAHILERQIVPTNSHHHQAVKALGSSMEAVAWAEDGIIEALESKDDSYVIGMQCHPESLEAKAVPELRKLFESFIKAASK